MTTTFPHHSDEALQADLASSMPGIVRQAEALLLLDNMEDRAVAARHARIAMNMTGGRPSDQMFSAVRYVQQVGRVEVSRRDDALCATATDPGARATARASARPDGRTDCRPIAYSGRRRATTYEETR